MRERERPEKPSRPPADGEKSKSKSSSSKTSSSSKAASSSSTAKKSSSSSSSKTSSSTPKAESSSSKPLKTSSSSSKPPKASSSSSKPPKASSTSSKPPKASSSSSSSKTRSTLESKSEKSSTSGSKSRTGGSKEGKSEQSSSRRVNEDKETRDSRKSEKLSSRKDGKASSSSVGREPGRSDRTSSRKSEKAPESIQGKELKREDKSSRSKGRDKDVSSSSQDNKRDHTPSSRRVVDSQQSSRSNKDKSSKDQSLNKSRSDKSSKKDGEKKSKSKSSKDEKIKEEKGKSDSKSARSREKSAKEHRSSRKEKISEDNEQDNRDSGIEGMSIQRAVMAPLRAQEVEAVELNQNSLETLESGISLSSPRDLSGDEAEVEESISSKMVEVDEVPEEGIQDDEDEAMIGDEIQEDDDMMEDEGAIPDEYMDGMYPSVTDFQNSVEASPSLNIHNGMHKENGIEDDGEELPEANGGEAEEQMPKETEALEADDETPNENGVEEADEYGDYEEDFESYESDFEDDTGSGDEEEEDEGDDDDTEDDEEEEDESDDETNDPTMTAVLQAMEKENNFDRTLERQYSFDDPSQDPRPVSSKVKGKQGAPATQENPNPNNPRPKTARNFVNFAVAKKKQEAAHISSKMNSRGRTLLSMIQLDTVSIDLFNLAPVSYEAYISSFGQSNRQQVSIQTNEDALNEEIQTEEINMRDKWTQKPVNISVGKDNQLPGPEDYMGVGGDMDPVTFSDLSSGKTNTARLTSFLTSASQVMLALLEEELVWKTAELNRPNSASMTTEGLGFSQPPVTLGASVQSLLEGRTTPFVKFCPTEPSMILSGHGFHSLEEDDKVELHDSGLLCVWWVQEPSRPQHLLSCCASPTAATFSPARPSLVLAGLEDGSLAAWDLREPLHLHTLDISIDDVKWKVRVPSFVTACSEGGHGEGSAIVSIHAVTTDQDVESDKIGSFQVVTLTASGLVTWWVVMKVPLTSAVGNINAGRKSATTRSIGGIAAVSPHLGSSPWARIAINRAATISVANCLYGDEAISSEVLCHDLRLDMNDPSQLYVATGSGAVAHCSRHISRIHPKAYMPEIEPGCEALCIALCPHDYRYMLVGSSDGLVRLHSMASERPLTSWQSAADCAPVQGVQWSPARPCVFYVLDSQARLHIWDLSAGDIFPVMTVEAGGLVGGTLGSFHIAPTHATSHHPLYAVFASDGGEMVLRQVGPEFGTHQLMDDYNTELERFTYYVNII